MKGRLLMLKPVILSGTPNAISLRASEDGHTLSGSRDGLTINLFGQEAAPVSRSRSVASAKALRTSATFGQNGSGSFESVSLQSFLESRLQARPFGSTECTMIWREKTTPLGRQYCQLAPLTRHTVATGSGLWPTPQARDHFPAHKPEYIEAKRKQGHGMFNLNDRVSELWPTPTAITDTGGAALCKWGGTRSREKLRQAVTSAELNGALNPDFPCWLMGYPAEWGSFAPLETPSSRKLRKSLSKRPVRQPTNEN